MNLQTGVHVSNLVMVVGAAFGAIGIILGALGGLGAYYFGDKISAKRETNTDQYQERAD